GRAPLPRVAGGASSADRARRQDGHAALRGGAFGGSRIREEGRKGSGRDPRGAASPQRGGAVRLPVPAGGVPGGRAEREAERRSDAARLTGEAARAGPDGERAEAPRARPPRRRQAR